MKKNLSIILSSIAIVGVITLAMIMIFKDITLSNISLESFISIIATLIGILVTFVVAWQIINGLEIKSKLAEIDCLKKQVEEQNITIENLSNKTLHHISLTMAQDTLEHDEAEEAFRYCLTSLVSTMKLDTPINIEKTLELLNECTKHFRNECRVGKEFYDETLKLDKEIRLINNYDFIRTQYEPLIEAYILKVKYE